MDSNYNKEVSYFLAKEMNDSFPFICSKNSWFKATEQEIEKFIYNFLQKRLDNTYKE